MVSWSPTKRARYEGDPSARRASATVYREPVTTMRSCPAAAAACAASIASATDAVARRPPRPRRRTPRRSGPHHPSARSRCAPRAPCRRAGASGRTMPATSLSALIETTRWRRSQVKNSRSATASASAPAGLCAPSNRIVGLARDDLQAAGPAHAVQRRAHRGVVEGPVHEGFERDDRRGRVPDRVLPEHRQIHVLVGAVHPSTAGTTARPPPGDDPRPPSRGTPGASRHRRRRTGPGARRAPRSPVPGTTAILPSLMIPAFSRATSVIVEPSSRWSRPMGVMMATSPATRFVASHRPPIPTSNTPRPTGLSANHRYASAVSASK